MKLKIFITIMIVGVIAYAASSNGRTAFAPAADFPRGALVYVQTGDLPALVKLWDESKLKDKYLESQNFAELTNRHLALKLVSRWQEFSDAAGFPLDLATLQTSSETGAAIAVYDIGKLEFVFIAPVSDEVFAATEFVRNQEKFEAETLPDETIVYSVAVEADRGRQKQKLLFAHARGRFVLATSEKLLLRTLANINGKSRKDRLSDETSFQVLSEKTEPRAATVWVNQTALNADYYFKRYWLMGNSDGLKNVRAGIFDLEINDDRIVERRKFLLDGAENFQSVQPAKANKILNALPADIPFYRLQAATPEVSADAIFDTILDRQQETGEEARQSYRPHYSSDDYNNYDDYGEQSYDYLSDKFDETIDDAGEEERTATNLGTSQESKMHLQNILRAANAQSVLTAARPQSLPMPLFVEFRRAAIFNLAAPEKFDRQEFESAIARSVAERVTASAPDAKLNWETRTETEIAWREIKLPMLGWEIAYATRGDELIVSNSRDFLREMTTARTAAPDKRIQTPFTELTVLNLDRRQTAYDDVFAELTDEKASGDFFAGNVASLLDVFSDVRRIEIKTSHSQNFSDEDVIMHLR